MPKKDIFEEKKTQVRPYSCLLLGFTCLLFLLNVSKMWLANLLTTIFTKKMSELIFTYSMQFTCDMYLMLYNEHYLQPASSCVLEFLKSRCPTLFGETCGSQFNG